MHRSQKYSAVFDRLEESLPHQIDRVADERAAAPGLLSDLLSLAEEPRYAAALAEPRFHIYALVCHALESSERMAGANPRATLELARLARLLASRVDPRSCGGPAALIDVEAYALAVEANALRLLGELPLARELFGGVRAILEQGGSDLFLNARTDCLEAQLLRDLGDPEEALRLAARALRSFMALGEKERARSLWDGGHAGFPLHLVSPPQGSTPSIH